MTFMLSLLARDRRGRARAGCRSRSTDRRSAVEPVVAFAQRRIHHDTHRSPLPGYDIHLCRASARVARRRPARRHLHAAHQGLHSRRRHRLGLEPLQEKSHTGCPSRRERHHRLGRPMNDVLVAIENVGNIEVAKLERRFTWIATTAAVPPCSGSSVRLPVW